MTVERVVAAVCAVAGVLLLAGTGWALLAASALLWMAHPSPQLADAWVVVRTRVVKVWAWLSGDGRRAAAATGLPAGVVFTPVGAGIMAGPGVAVLTAGILLVATSLLLGWNH